MKRSQVYRWDWTHWSVWFPPRQCWCCSRKYNSNWHSYPDVVPWTLSVSKDNFWGKPSCNWSAFACSCEQNLVLFVWRHPETPYSPAQPQCVKFVFVWNNQDALLFHFVQLLRCRTRGNCRAIQITIISPPSLLHSPHGAISSPYSTGSTAGHMYCAMAKWSYCKYTFLIVCVYFEQSDFFSRARAMQSVMFSNWLQAEVSRGVPFHSWM